MINRKNFPYRCSYLWYYIRIEKLTGEQIAAKVKEIDAWLNETCIITCMDWFSPMADGQYPVIKEEQWMWSVTTSRVPARHNRFGMPKAPVKTPVSYSYNWNEIYLSDNISFMHQDDLLAFKLKFGITEVTHPDI
jgi:hypothetical protein